MYKSYFTLQSGLDSEQYSKKTRNIVTRLNPDRINMDLIMVQNKY